MSLSRIYKKNNIEPDNKHKTDAIRYTHLSDSDDSVIYYTYLLIFLAIDPVYTSNTIHGMTPINVAKI